MGLFKTGFTKQHLPRPERLTTVLAVLAAVTILLAIVAAATEIVTNWHTGNVRFLLVALLLTGGASGAAALMALAALLRYLFSLAISSRLMERSQRESRRLSLSQTPSDAEARGDSEATAPAGAEAPRAATAEQPAAPLDRPDIAELLTEIIENTLLSEPERREKLETFRQQRLEAIRSNIETLIEQAQWTEAEKMLDELRRRYPKSAEADDIQKQLGAAIRDFEAAEIQNAGEQIRSYTSLGLWDRALDVAREVAERYPRNRDAQQLVNSIDLEHEATMKEDCQRLYREIEHLVGRRHWREAHTTAGTLLQRYPDSPEANKLRGQIAELKRNAEVQERREAEQLITAHLHEGRYREAYDIAHDLIEKYPDSPQAAALKERMEWLRERAGIIE